MKQAYLLDTHVLLWSLEKNTFLPNEIIKILENGSIQIYISMASLWEIAIKVQIKKLKLAKSLKISQILTHSFFELLNVKLNHIDGLSKIKPIHRDPFDHLLIAQALSEDLVLITHDAIFKKYLTRKNILFF